MLNLWTNFDRSFAALDDLQRRTDRAYWAPSVRVGSWPALPAPRAWPAAELEDTEGELVLTVDLPGMRAEDLDLQVTADSLTIEGERTVTAPEGYADRSLCRRPRPRRRANEHEGNQAAPGVDAEGRHPRER
jgi:HSP20 family molecular chaperone IbpA